MNSGNVWLAIAKIIISRERSQHFFLKGWNSGIEFQCHAYASDCVWRNTQTFTDSTHNPKRKWQHIIERNKKYMNHKIYAL